MSMKPRLYRFQSPLSAKQTFPLYVVLLNFGAVLVRNLPCLKTFVGLLKRSPVLLFERVDLFNHMLQPMGNGLLRYDPQGTVESEFARAFREDLE